MVSASLNWAEAAGAELDDVPELLGFTAGVLLASELPDPVSAEQPARAIAAAMTAAKMVRVFFMKIRVLECISGAWRLYGCVR